MNEQEFLNLEQQLNEYEYAYRVLDEPIVSDQEFDNLFSSYKQEAKLHPDWVSQNSLINKVGSVLTDGFKKVEHSFLMGSLENTYSHEELEKWMLSISNELNILPSTLKFDVEDKYDGISGSLKYENGLLVSSASRGDGKIGDDLTNNSKMVWNIPLKLSSDFTGEIRGEFIILKKDLDRINKLENSEFKNCRNLVSGTMKSLDSSIVRKRFVHFIPYYFYNENNEEIDGSNLRQEFLLKNVTKNNNFYYHDKHNISIEEVLKTIKYNETPSNEKLYNLSYYKNRPYPTDGLVIKVSDFALRKRLGIGTTCPKWAKAYKFEQEKAITTVKSIIWQVGRDRITPVAELESVDLEGTTVSRATVHNVSQIKKLGIGIGSKVEIEKAGFIIPYINKVVENKQEAVIPDKCPVCGSETKIVKDNAEFLICVNENCSAKLKANIEYSLKAIEVDNIGESLISQLVDNGFVKTPLDVLKLKEEQLLSIDRMGKTIVNKIIRNLKKAIVQPLSKVIEFLGIPNVGKNTSEKLSNKFNSLSELSNADLISLTQINDIGEQTADNIITYLTKNKEYVQQVNEFFILQQKKQTNSSLLEGLKFVVTGTATKPRGELEKLIKDNGGEFSGSVSKKTNYLIMGSLEKEGFTSTKAKKANELNVPIVDEFWLFDKLGMNEEKENNIEVEESLNDLF